MDIIWAIFYPRRHSALLLRCLLFLSFSIMLDTEKKKKKKKHARALHGFPPLRCRCPSPLGFYRSGFPRGWAILTIFACRPSLLLQGSLVEHWEMLRALGQQGSGVQYHWWWIKRPCWIYATVRVCCFGLAKTKRQESALTAEIKHTHWAGALNDGYLFCCSNSARALTRRIHNA